MSHQTTLQEFYKCKASPPPGAVTNNNSRKRRNLSLIKRVTPKKCPKTITSNESVINLVSDDESFTEDLDNSSQSSIQSVPIEDKVLTPSTPRKSPSNNLPSPKKAKFFSPVKKRAVFKTPTKRNLARELYDSSPTKMSQDEDFSKACEGMDDKSIFLLTVINKFLKNGNLRDLLDEASINLLNQCLQLIKPGIRLVCRLYWRQHRWFREEQLVSISSDKSEQTNENFRSMLNCLLENGLLVSSFSAGANTMTFEEIAKVLKSDELKQICKDLKMKIQKKDDAVDALRKFMKQSSISKYFMGKSNNCDNSKRVMQVMHSKLGTCYKLSDLASMTLYKVYLLMYLGMNYSVIRDKKLEITLINSKIRTETYPTEDIEVDDASVVFKTRDDFIKYLKAQIIYENYLSVTDSCEQCQMVRDAFRRYKAIDEDDFKRYKSLPTWLRRYTPGHIYVKMLEMGVQELKKEKCLESYRLCVDILTVLVSQCLFRQHQKAEWFAEKGLILHKLMARHDEAAEALVEGLKSDLPEEAKDVIRPRALKIANQQNITLRDDLKEALIALSHEDVILESSFSAEHINKQHMENPSVQRGKKKFVVDSGEGRLYLDAEEYCAHYYKETGAYTDAEHWEGRIVTTIFFLLFWEVIYTKPRGVPGIFLSQYQLYPLDMFTEDFYQNRKRVIDDRLRDIEEMTTEQLIEDMRRTLEARPEQELSGINRGISFEDIRGVSCCLGPRRVSRLCARLATNYRHWSGFPDLTLWNNSTEQIKFVEVKTDTDKPSRKQLQWMQYLRDNGIDTGFCYVGAFTTKCRARASGAMETADETSQSPKPPRTPRKNAKSQVTPETPKVPRTLDDEEFVPKKSKSTINIRSVADINRRTEIV